MELIIILAIIFILYQIIYSSRKSEVIVKTRPLEKSKPKVSPKKQKPKVKKKRYSPGQYRRKPTIDPKSKLDPISPRKFVVCEVCGAERMYRENMKACCE